MQQTNGSHDPPLTAILGDLIQRLDADFPHWHLEKANAGRYRLLSFKMDEWKTKDILWIEAPTLAKLAHKTDRALALRTP